MPHTDPVLFAGLALLAFCARALVVCLRHRRDPGPAVEQLIEGVSLGVLIALGGFSAFAQIVAA